MSPSVLHRDRLPALDIEAKPDDAAARPKADAPDESGGLSVHRITRRNAPPPEPQKAREKLGCRTALPSMKYICACESRAWTVASWHRGEPSVKRLRPFRCRSWRHAGPCRAWKGAQDFVRIKEAIESLRNWHFVVLTFNPKNEISEWESYKDGGRRWDALRKRLEREFGMKLPYLQTWERHRSGFPHVNLLVSSAEWSASCDLPQCLHSGADGGLCASYSALRRRIKAHAVAVGFGPIIWLEPLREPEAIAGYLVKCANEMTGGGKDYQIPVDAPRHFRRLRASRGLLPPVAKGSDEWTGQLIQQSTHTVEVLYREQSEQLRHDAEYQAWKKSAIRFAMEEESTAATLQRALSTLGDFGQDRSFLTDDEYRVLCASESSRAVVRTIPFKERVPCPLRN